MRNAATQVVADLVPLDSRVIAIAVDQGNEIYDWIKGHYPDQYIDYGIAECNMLASVAGLAAEGFIPFIYTLSNFLSMRGYEFIRNAICYKNFNVKMLGRSFGFASSHMSMTHQATEDFAILRTLENLKVIYPATPIEAREATKFAYRQNGPVYICLEGTNEQEFFGQDYAFDINAANVLKDGNDISLVCIGSICAEALQAAEMLVNEYSVQVISVSVVKPLDLATILDAARKTSAMLTIEEQTVYGGLGSAVAECLAEHGLGIRFGRIGLTTFAHVAGNRQFMREFYGLTAPQIAQAVRRLLA